MNDFSKIKIMKMTNILKTALKVNETKQFTVFIDVHGHVDSLGIRYCKGGWAKNKQMQKLCDLFLDSDPWYFRSNEGQIVKRLIEVENKAKELLKEARKLEKAENTAKMKQLERGVMKCT